MTELQLELRSISKSEKNTAKTTAAFLVPSADPKDCMVAIGHLNKPEAAQLLVLPQSRQNPAMGSALVIPADEDKNFMEKSGQLLQNYSCRAGKLYLPRGSEIWPPLDDREVERLFTWDKVIWHPGLGPIGFAAKDIRTVSDLFDAPPPLPFVWQSGFPGTPPPRLTAIIVEQPPEDEILQDAGQDIGTSPPSEIDADDKKNKKTQGLQGDTPIELLGNAVLGFGGMIARGLGDLAGGKDGKDEKQNADKGGESGNSNMLANMFSKIGDWAEDKAENLAAKRQSELDRLMDMLNHEPDKGLRYAMPLGKTAWRGQSKNPGWRLNEHATTFGANQHAKNADFWDLKPEFRKRLQLKYRELAQVEINKGNYERAAYIHAELLGDWASAADCLKRGRMYRQAASIYIHKLHNKRDAAICLTKGGLLHEALVLFEELHDHFNAGNLHKQLGNIEAARLCWQRAAKEHVKTKKFLDAANVYVKCLQDSEAALSMLRDTWPRSNYAAEHLQRWFEIAASVNKSDEIYARVNRFATDTPTAQAAGNVVKVLQNVTTKSSDLKLRQLALNAATNIVGKRLPHASMNEKRTLLDHYGKLRPHDKLLVRDSNRYLTSQKADIRYKPADSVPGISCTVEYEFLLQHGAQWLDLLSLGDQFLAVGNMAGKLVLVRGNWTRRIQSREFVAMGPSPAHNSARLFDMGLKRPVLFTPLVGMFPELTFYPWENRLDALQLNSTQWLPAETSHVAPGEHGQTHILQSMAGEPVVTICDQNGRQLSVTNIPNGIFEVDDPAVCGLFAGRNTSWLVMATQLVVFDGSVEPTVLPVEQTIVNVKSSGSIRNTTFIVGYEQGARILVPAGRPGNRSLAEIYLNTDQAAPAVILLRNGFAVSIAETLRVYRVLQHSAELLLDQPLSNSSGVADLVLTDKVNGCAILFNDGYMQTLKIES